MTEDREVFENAEAGRRWDGRTMWWLWKIKEWKWHQRSATRPWAGLHLWPHQTLCSQSPQDWSMIDRWNQRGRCLPRTDWLSGRLNLDRSFLLIGSNERRHTRLRQNPAICGSSVGLWPTLPTQVNTTSEDSSSVSFFSCHPVFSSPSHFPTAVGAPPPPPTPPPLLAPPCSV